MKEQRHFTAEVRLVGIYAIAMAIGACCALAALVLLRLIDLFTNLFYFQHLSLQPRSPADHALGWASVLVPMLASLKAGDVVLVTKFDRLGRSTRELLDLIERISKAGGAFRSIGDPLWDTSSSPGRLLSTLLAAIAEFERDLIKERTGEGRKRAMANGVKFGRRA